MRTVTLIRKKPDAREAEGTFGSILISPLPIFFTAELPWRNNLPNISCLPIGTYRCEWALSPKRQRNVYFIREDFPDRDAFQIHAGNYVGDVEKGFKADALGCILLGNKFVDTPLGTQRMISDSKAAVKRFEEFMNGESFLLEIVEEA